MTLYDIKLVSALDNFDTKFKQTAIRIYELEIKIKTIICSKF